MKLKTRKSKKSYTVMIISDSLNEEKNFISMPDWQEQ